MSLQQELLLPGVVTCYTICLQSFAMCTPVCRGGGALSRRAGLYIISCQSNFKQKEPSVCFQIDTLLRGDAPNLRCSSRIASPQEIMSTYATSICPTMSPKYALTLYCFSTRIFFFNSFLYKLFVASKYWCD